MNFAAVSLPPLITNEITPAVPKREILFSKLMVLIAFKSRICNGLYLVIAFEEFCHCERILAILLHSYRGEFQVPD